MLAHLENLKPNRPKVETSAQKKILCIIEGDLEFRYISKIFKLCGYDKGCYELSEEFIKIAWGKNIPTQNIVDKNCLFKGGSLKGSKVPFPAIGAFEIFERDLSIFDSVIVFFDGDKDIDDEVRNYFIKKFSSLEINNCLLVSSPCFESTLIDFCYCGSCRKIINYIPNKSIYPCVKYKGESKNKKFKGERYKGEFRRLPCFAPPNSFIDSELKMHNLLEASELNYVNNIIEKFML
ncbi:hypothetical protein [Sulfurimonas sp.]|uniref:hypothetical protein n=1 Tax=Sulfurimonas sp. TaxID=2022749 RepID=UPI0025CFB1C7|nr:hypothetical protein [Sulfurimonas sp.]